MRSLYINFIALVAPGTDGTRVIFPKAGHRLRVFRGSTELPLGKRMAIIARDANGVEQKLGGPESPKVGGRVFSIKTATGRTVKPKSDSDLLKGLAQTILFIGGGRFVPQDAVKAEQYTEADWEFEGTTHTQKLTDLVIWQPTRPALRYFLRNLDTGHEEPIGATEDVYFANHDALGAEPQPEEGKIRIAEVHSIYDLVEPDGSRPIPVTDPRPEDHPEWVKPARVPGDLEAEEMNPERPLCPVGEP